MSFKEKQRNVDIIRERNKSREKLRSDKMKTEIEGEGERDVF